MRLTAFCSEHKYQYKMEYTSKTETDKDFHLGKESPINQTLNGNQLDAVKT